MRTFRPTPRQLLHATRSLAVIVVWIARTAFADDHVKTTPNTEKVPTSTGQSLDPLFEPFISLIRDRESVQMISAITSGSSMGPGDGWFHSSQTRYDWKWLAERHGIAGDGAITADAFQGGRESFEQLDRDRDGLLKAGDFDWSDNSVYSRQMSQIGNWFRGIDESSNGRITREEWEQYFENLAGDKGFVTPEDLRAKLFPAPSKAAANQGPSKTALMKGLFAGELGSYLEGPSLNAEAPDFELRTQDGGRSIRLSSFREKKPVVLIFGSFT